MIITLSSCTSLCQSVAEVSLSGVAPLGAISHRFNLIITKVSKLDYCHGISYRRCLISLEEWAFVMLLKKICMFLSCRPFVVITTFSTGLVGVEVTSVN
jgi:hypothetical protein